MRDSALKRTLLVIWNCYWDRWRKLKKSIDPANNTWLVCHGPEWLSLILDRFYLRRMFRNTFGYGIDLKNPRTFNEKLNWLKLYNRNPLYTTLVDKYKVKEFVAKEIGEEYVIPLIKVYRKAEDINFDELPNQFVLKCNHNSDVIIVRDKTKIDRNNVVQRLSQQLKQGHYYDYREWPYRNVEPAIIAEKYMQDGNEIELKDYKFWCFNNKPHYCQVISGHETGLTIDFFDNEWNHQSFVGMLDTNRNHPPCIEKQITLNAIIQPLKPEGFARMKEIALRLASKVNAPFVRIDLYYINKRIYFGEITFFPLAGIGCFSPAKWDNVFGDYIDLSSLRNN